MVNAICAMRRATSDWSFIVPPRITQSTASPTRTAPPSGVESSWTVAAERGPRRAAADGRTAHWVPDAPGADLFVVVGDGKAVLAEASDVTVEPVMRYDATRSLGHVTVNGGTELTADAELLANAWHLQSALLGAESLGAVERALEVSVTYAKERFTFGRAIGSYQAMKHQLVEILRLSDNAKSLMLYAGWAGADQPDEFPLAASAFRLKAGKAIEEASRIQISVHGGIGATFEHDAPLYFRKAQLSRRLLGGTAGAADRVADELFKRASVEAA